MRRGLLPRDPTLAIDRASREERVRAQFTIDDLRAMLTAQLADASPEYHRLVALLAYTGMRFREAALARWEDIDWSGRCILVRVGPGRRVKRNRERLIPLQDELAAVLEPHRQEAGPLTQGQEWNPTRGFRSYLKRAGVAVDGRSPHSLRHTYAGIMTATGVPAQLLMAYLGHSSAATMLRYTRLAARFVAVTEREKWQRGEIRICKQGAIRSGDVSREQI
jgi:integrase